MNHGDQFLLFVTRPVRRKNFFYNMFKKIFNNNLSKCMYTATFGSTFLLYMCANVMYMYVYMYYKLSNIDAIYTENENITINMTNSMFSSPNITVTSSSPSPLDFGQYASL